MEVDLEIEKVILANLLTREEYARKVFPFIKAEYFESRSSKELFKLYRNYVAEYGEIPTKSALLVELEENERLDQDTVNEITELIKVCFDYADEPDIDWLVESTESFCRDRAVFLAVEKSITILDGEDKKTPKTQIPELLSEALAVSFDTDVGHDFLGNAEQRWDFYHKKEERLPFNLDWFNKITDGGLPKKTLSAFLAPTNVGKTLVMCHLA
ncbi:MAG: DNA primase, partial [Methanobacteriota archaeon]